MKINHKLIRTILQIVGISIFLVSIFFKLRAIILVGGTKILSDELEKNDESQAGEEVCAAKTEPAIEAERAMPMPMQSYDRVCKRSY